MATRTSVTLKNFDMLEQPQEVLDYVEAHLLELAEEIMAEAKAEHFPKSETGNLVKSIRVKKSRYENGGYIVQATAPHAFNVEYGHAMVTHDGIVIGHVAAHPFLRGARNKVLRRAVTRSQNG